MSAVDLQPPTPGEVRAALRLDALKEAEAFVERLDAKPQAPTERQAQRREPATAPSLGDRISQILRVADYLLGEEPRR